MGSPEDGVCSLCMEELDLTDRQLKPCICGYEICVWCWHHVVETAAKDGHDALCPACRSPYDTERILKRTISKERLAELNSIKKQKLQKTKQIVSDLGFLSTVRVIRRNIVYLAGIPTSLADDKTLRKKEYLGQYGRIVKIVITQTDVSRQYHSSESCIVYVTFSKEEEALRCIEAVSGYILRGKPLKACFGTTRYCHSWLRNHHCNNPDCLYVHEAVPKEDICTREEVMSFCTSKLQQCSGLAVDNLKQRSGNFFPPPLDTKNSLPKLCVTSNGRNAQNDCFARSYASVAAPHNQSKLPGMNNSKPSNGLDVHIEENPWDDEQSSNRIPTSQIVSVPNMGNSEYNAHPKELDGNHYLEKSYNSGSNSTSGTNIVTQDNMCKSSYVDGNGKSVRFIAEDFLLNSDGYSPVLQNAANLVVHATTSNLSCSTNCSKFSEPLKTMQSYSSQWDDPVDFSRRTDLLSTMRTLAYDSTLALQNIMASYDWPRMHSNLEPLKPMYYCEDQSFPFSYDRESKGVCSPSRNTSTRTLRHIVDKPSAYMPTGPVIYNDVQENQIDNSSGVGFSFSQKDTARDQKLFGIEANKCFQHSDRRDADSKPKCTVSTASHANQREDRLLSGMLGLDLDETDVWTDSHSVAEEFCDADGLVKMTKHWLSPVNGEAQSSLKLMDCWHAFAAAKLSSTCTDVPRSGPWPDVMKKQETYGSDSSSNFNLEVSKNSKVLNSSSILSATGAAGDFANLIMHHSGSSFSRNTSHCPYSRYTHRTTFSTPPGFPPRKTDEGQSLENLKYSSSAQNQQQDIFSGTYPSRTMKRSNSHHTAFRCPYSAEPVSFYTRDCCDSLAGIIGDHKVIKSGSGPESSRQISKISSDYSQMDASQHSPLQGFSENYNQTLESSYLVSPNVNDYF